MPDRLLISQKILNRTKKHQGRVGSIRNSLSWQARLTSRSSGNKHEMVLQIDIFTSVFSVDSRRRAFTHSSIQVASPAPSVCEQASKKCYLNLHSSMQICEFSNFKTEVCFLRFCNRPSMKITPPKHCGCGVCVWNEL